MDTTPLVRKTLLTTHSDLSLDYFSGWQVYYYEDLPLTPPPSDILYCRDPFNNPNFTPIAEPIDTFIQQVSAPNSVDRIENSSDILSYEDKWLQFQRYGELMPATELASDAEFILGQHLAKPRVSQRAKGIVFDTADFDKITDTTQFIIQNILPIHEEIRVYALGGKIFDQATIKSSKTADTKVKVLSARPLTATERDFAKLVIAKTPDLDFVGLDIAILSNGELKLIEVNRSPQFKRYAELTGINPIANIEELYD